MAENEIQATDMNGDHFVGRVTRPCTAGHGSVALAALLSQPRVPVRDDGCAPTPPCAARPMELLSAGCHRTPTPEHAPDLAGATRTTAPGLAFPAHAPEETVRTAWQKRDARLHLHLPGRLLRAEVAFDIDACTSVGTWHAGTPFAWTTPGAPPTNERTISG